MPASRGVIRGLNQEGYLAERGLLATVGAY